MCSFRRVHGRGADPFGRQRQDHRLGPRGTADAGGGVGEDHAVLRRNSGRYRDSSVSVAAASDLDSLKGRLDAVLVLADSPVFSVEAVSMLASASAKLKVPGYFLSRDRCVHSFDKVEPFIDIWRNAFLISLPPKNGTEV